MTKNEFLEKLDDLIEEYILENDNYEDIDEGYSMRYQNKPNTWNVNIGILKQ